MSQTTAGSPAGSGKKKGTSDGSDGKGGTASSPARSKSSRSETKALKETSTFYKQWVSWRQYIRKHTQDLREAVPVVDDKAPRLNIPQLYDAESLKVEQKDILMFYSLNPELVKLLHLINVFGGRTETFKFDYSRLLPSSNFLARRCAALDIEKTNRALKEMIDTTGPRLPTVKDYAKSWKRTEALMEFNSQFPLFWKVKKRKKRESVEVGPSRMYLKQHVTEKSAKYPDKRPRVFFEISIKSVGSIGKLVVLLYSDYVPMTVKNFLAFCNPRAKLTYKGCRFYLIFQNFYCQTGDVVENKGFGGTSIYGPYFGDEDHTLQHGERGILTMFNLIPNRNQCQFLITFRELKALNGSNVVFGKVIRGFHVLDAIESVGSRMTGRPKVDIFISDCDEI